MKKILLYLLFIPFVSISQNCNTYYLQLNDSLGDGWNGNYISIIDSSGNIVFSTTLDSGLTTIDSVCLIDDCYTISCDSGFSQNEINWSFFQIMEWNYFLEVLLFLIQYVFRMTVLLP